MSRTRKINSTIAKNALKSYTFRKPNKLKHHKGHGIYIGKYILKYIKNDYSPKSAGDI